MMKANEYKLLDECVELGIRVGWGRAHKHDDSPQLQVILDNIKNAVMLEIVEYFWFPEVNDD